MKTRPAAEADLSAVITVQARAGDLFRHVNMAKVADGELPTVEQLRPTVRDGRLLVSTDDDDRPVAFVLTDWVDARAHLDQVSVDPAFAGHGLGRQLMAAAEQWGRHRGSSTMTLTTFVDVAWNGPYYRRLGWRDLPARPGSRTTLRSPTRWRSCAPARASLAGPWSGSAPLPASSPIAYVQQLAIQAARRLLDRTTMPVDEVGFAVGYQNTAYFRRLFNRTTRLGPGAYRRKFGGARVR